jgi:hypothetical protein
LAIQPCLLNHHVDLQLNQVKVIPEDTWLSSPGYLSSMLNLQLDVKVILEYLAVQPWLFNHRVDLQ